MPVLVELGRSATITATMDTYGQVITSVALMVHSMEVGACR